MVEKWKTGISNSNLHFYQTKTSARKNYSKETWISLARIKHHQREWNLVRIIGLNFRNFVSNPISIWLFVYFQTFMQMKIKFVWLQMKKPSEISTLLVYSNVIHRNVNIYLWMNTWWTNVLYNGISSLFCQLIFDFKSKLFLINFPSMKTLLFIKYSYLAIPSIWLADSLSNALLTETEQALSGKSRRDASINSYLHKSSFDGVNS